MIENESQHSSKTLSFPNLSYTVPKCVSSPMILINFRQFFYIVVVKEGPHDRTVIFSGVFMLRNETSLKVVNIQDFRSFGDRCHLPNLPE